MRFRLFVHFIAVGVLCTPMLASTSFADQTDPVTVASPPTGQGPAFVPGVRLVDDLPADYIEEEFFISGEADLYNYAHNPPEGPTDIATIQEDVPYKTRIIVRRPAKANKFNGTVVIEWWNSTAGFDTAPAWDPSAEYFANSGIVYVGVTNSTTSLGFLVGGCRLLGFLPPSCGTRYSTLSLPNNGLAWDVMSQIANLLKSDDVSNPLPVDYVVERVLHVGESQQAGSVITYASGFHLDGLNDGYFIQSGINSRPINFGPACGADGSPAFPDCTPRLSFPTSRVSTDLPVPVYQTVTQTDFEGLGFSVFGRQADTSTFRYYEIAGAAHSTVHEGIEIIPAGVFGPNPILLTDLCLEQLNTVADGPVFGSYVLNALWERMQEQLIDGDEPPAGVLMDEDEFVLNRDSNDNVEGGVRLPSMEAPTATYVSSATANPFLPPQLAGIANLACRLSGAVFPFDDATLGALYPDHSTYVSQVVESANALKSQGLMLQQDVVAVKTAAAASDIGQ
ncbi:MAG: hypothetical protein JRH14_17900 [Deltaproteobacteria bacterium]|nr:hypothetical protein [Deltaproteobacteria bacterium]MBW2161810.1 hypothetical protein [Deltaproteobacteria bacterium]